MNIGDMPVEISEFFGSMIAMDAPRHSKLRGIVQRAFTPRTVRQIEGYVHENRLPDIRITGEPDMLQSSFIHGIKRMPCAFTPR